MKNSSAEMSGRPLDNIRVLDFSHAAAAPFATMFLADLGAEIVKIERPGTGDGARSMGSPMPMLGEKESEYFVALNRNKRSLALDLSVPQGVALAKKLVQKSDIVFQNFRPGVMDRLGLGFEELRGLREGLVYCSISAFGTSGPLAHQPANDIIMQSLSGLMGITGEVGGGPVRIGAPISDYSSGLFAMSGVLAALFARGRFPDGQHIEVSMLESSLNMMCNYIPSSATLGKAVPRVGRGHAQIVPYQAFLAADGQYVMVGAFTRIFWQNLCRAVGHIEWIEDPRFRSNHLRLTNRNVLIADLEKIFAKRTSLEWLQILDEADVPSSPVLELHDAVRSQQVVSAGSICEIGTGACTIKVAHSPIRSSEWLDCGVGRPAPRLGADSNAVLVEVLGLSANEISRLGDEGVVGIAAEAGESI
tara:strand:+ start:391 stop:1647 length:1257 start_codon:yes stop_codon:yes gene_type:complete